MIWRSASLQFVWHPLFDEGKIAWSFGYWRWPRADILAEIADDLKPYGFHGLQLGPLELRFWPRRCHVEKEYAGVDKRDAT